MTSSRCNERPVTQRSMPTLKIDVVSQFKQGFELCWTESLARMAQSVYWLCCSMADPGFVIQQILSNPTKSSPALEPTQLHIQWVPGEFPLHPTPQHSSWGLKLTTLFHPMSRLRVVETAHVFKAWAVKSFPFLQIYWPENNLKPHIRIAICLLCLLYLLTEQ